MRVGVPRDSGGEGMGGQFVREQSASPSLPGNPAWQSLLHVFPDHLLFSQITSFSL